MKIMKTIMILGLACLNFGVLSEATELKILTTPGAERDQLEQNYQAQMKAGNADTTVLRELGIIYHMKTVENPREPQMAKKTNDLLKKAYANDKSNPLTKAYLGSITTMMATTVEDGMQKMKFVKRGTRHMDKAIKDRPDDINLRMLRGNNSLNLPKFLKRARYAVQDFSHVLKLTKNAPADFRATVHFNLGKAYERIEEFDKAKAQWQQVIQQFPDSSVAKQAQEKL